jgi:copper chaperone CopZ
MKYIKILLLSILFVQFGVNSPAQNPKSITATFWVASVCQTCKATIEKTMDTKGVVQATYDLETQMLTVTYKPKKISEAKLHELLNAVGYDTAVSKCSDEQYSRVHNCCRYRELEKH